MLLAGEACAGNTGLGEVAKRLATLATQELPLPYDEALNERVEHYFSLPLEASFVDFEPFFEEELSSRNMPVGMKYLPVALSGMDGSFEKGDRCGVWAMSTVVALRYGLKVDASADERFSVEASTRAALDYLCDLYGQYHNWWFCILAYANSATALHHALMKSERYVDLWDFYHEGLLPDSRVVADFIGCYYVYSAENRVVAQPKVAQPKVAQPSCQPVASATPTVAVVEKKVDAVAKPSVKENAAKYTVKKGDNLGKIAKKYHVKVEDIKRWNHLKSDMIRDGQRLVIRK